MQISHIQGGVLRVLLSDDDLLKFGTDFASLRENDPQTKAIIRRILHAVSEKQPLPQETAVTVEAIPTDGGCLLLITPQLPAAENVYTVWVAEEQALLQLKENLRTLPDGVISTVLYRLPHGFCFAVYCERLSDEVAAVLYEFGTVHTGSVPAARAAEFALESMHNL